MMTVTPASAPARRAQHLTALGAFVLAAATLLWPLLTGHILFGGTSSDMYLAGYAFRKFGAERFLATGAIPQWNPYLFGGLPYIGAMHGDIFYPTAWLRWIMPVDLAITWGMVLHFVLAGWFMYRFVLALETRWGAALVAGVSYELTGIVASQMSPGHDGKLFVSALAPLAFWVLLRTIRHRDPWGYAALAVVVALAILGHYHMAYFLFLAMGLWALYLVFWDAERSADARPWRILAGCAGAVALGVGISALQVLPFVAYIPYSPRAAGGPATGWEFATSYAFPPAEIVTAILPQFNGVLDHYWGSNPIKLHTEYLGMLPVALAMLAWGDRPRRRLVTALGIGALAFLLFSFAGHTPFYRPFFELLPGLKKIRAMGMVFYLVAFFVAALAGLGADRLLERRVSTRRALLVGGGFVLFALLGVSGALQGVAESLAIPERFDAVTANASELRVGALRLLLVAVLGATILWAVAVGRLPARVSPFVVSALIVADLWSVDRQFYTFSPRAQVLFADDAVTRHLKQVPLPYRVLDAGMTYGRTSILMGYGIPQALGYHGFELRAYDELGGADNGWQRLLTPNVLDVLAIRFLLLGAAQAVPGFHHVLGPVLTSAGETAVLYERDTLPSYARVIVAAAKVPAEQTVATLADPRLPIRDIALFHDTASVATVVDKPPFPTSRVRATVEAWSPGRMAIALSGADSTTGHLVVSENWYPDWHATVDGATATVRRADHTLLSVDLPPGARRVELTFASRAYAVGKWISAVSTLGTLLWLVIALRGPRDRVPRQQESVNA